MFVKYPFLMSMTLQLTIIKCAKYTFNLFYFHTLKW